MKTKPKYIFKIADHEEEFKQIHRLNYDTFVHEIPQHSQNDIGLLIDRFHSENTYLICIRDKEVIGMIAIRGERPFSLDGKIGPVEKALPVKVNRLCEIRLLSIRKEYRKGRVFLGLIRLLAQYGLKKGYDATVISGTTRELKLYTQMGFLPFADITGNEDASFQPMYLTKQRFEEIISRKFTSSFCSFIPGPMNVSAEVRKQLASQPVSHRSEECRVLMDEVRNSLCELANARYAQVLLGSGTLANDAIAGQLSKLPGKGLILVNGEFGSRLKDHAARFSLEYYTYEKKWGEAFHIEELQKVLQQDISWIWMVHCETSTGLLNPLEDVKKIALENGLFLCADCISSFGAVPVDLKGVYLASAVSGKALKAYTGLSFVFHNHEIGTSATLPRYLDLGSYFSNGSVPFSHSSNLLKALQVSLLERKKDTFIRIQSHSEYVRNQLKHLNITFIGDEKHLSPIILAIQMPSSVHSFNFGRTLEFQGCIIHYASSYLQERNWLQISFINTDQEEHYKQLVDLFTEIFEYETSLRMLDTVK
ncbi:aminotransferase class V-fold PLP-dependent enzyme [Bacillus sp. 1P06AnD]|uniref:aminotransferase class V-fold PLP-dependent enzyme n=1 Tax=Bacillus sp. 1P06AnD TaxID=3132208 RepID=UPI0039A3EA18